MKSPISYSLSLVKTSSSAVAMADAEFRSLQSSLWGRDPRFRRRVAYHWKKNQEEPGDCKGMPALLMGLAIATAHVGIRPGWIPEVQRLGCIIEPIVSPIFNQN